MAFIDHVWEVCMGLSVGDSIILGKDQGVQEGTITAFVHHMDTNIHYAIIKIGRKNVQYSLDVMKRWLTQGLLRKLPLTDGVQGRLW